ncbi:secreted RxLR effector protein 161-like [Juglans microcarpa x Juglans regia]|uniref:secreted RxLR effector protein 161-like n=1 Tax=Juglans microcarpa x Juglans regia TaxID=2249226 RepID=UPI001B7DFA49|nr:secreted RxLR effector protein 161-like [Juglans microcarpa x Juglans regia]
MRSLMYAQICTRPDIAYAVNVLSRFQSNPRQEHWKAAKKVMRYLKKTEGYILTFQHSNHLEVVGYSDSDFAVYQDDLKSTLGYVFMLVGGAISWKSVKQTLVASSTMQADNSAVVFFSKNNKSSSGSKYIDIKYLVVRDRVKEWQTKIEHINKEAMIADPLTRDSLLMFLKHMLLIWVLWKLLMFLVSGSYLCKNNYVLA